MYEGNQSSFENIMENGAFALEDLCSIIFSNTRYFKGDKRCFYGVKG